MCACSYNALFIGLFAVEIGEITGRLACDSIVRMRKISKNKLLFILLKIATETKNSVLSH